jgi:hypothetical protein
VTRYEREFGTDWETLDDEEATDRAYAIGVAERFGERHRDELQLIYDAVDTAYARSMIELAYEEGRQEAMAVADDAKSVDEVWDDLVGDGAPDSDHGDAIGGRDGLPESLDRYAMLDRPTPDSTDATDRPGFLDR